MCIIDITMREREHRGREHTERAREQRGREPPMGKNKRNQHHVAHHVSPNVRQIIKTNNHPFIRNYFLYKNIHSIVYVGFRMVSTWLKVRTKLYVCGLGTL